MFSHVSVTIEVDTGNIPFTAVLYSNQLNPRHIPIWKAAEVYGIFYNTCPFLSMNEYLDILVKGLVFLCANPDIYYTEEGQIISMSEYYEAIRFLSEFITACFKYPKAFIISSASEAFMESSVPKGLNNAS